MSEVVSIGQADNQVVGLQEVLEFIDKGLEDFLGVLEISRQRPNVVSPINLLLCSSRRSVEV